MPNMPMVIRSLGGNWFSRPKARRRHDLRGGHGGHRPGQEAAARNASGLDIVRPHMFWIAMSLSSLSVILWATWN